MKSVFARLLLLTLLMAGAAYAIWWDAETLLRQPLLLSQKLRIEINQGENLAASVNDPEIKKLLPADRLTYYLQLYARITGKASAIKAGEYELLPRMSSLDFLNLIVSGKVVLHELRLIEGWNFKQVMASVSASNELVHTLNVGDAEKVMSSIGQAGRHPEGRFFPDTYRFPKNTTDVGFLRRAFTSMQNTLQQEWNGRAPELPYRSPEEALIMASIIEKETATVAERAQIAGVFVRRLLLGMKLQTDPTVIFGIGESFDGNLRRSDLETDTPYNTYTRSGLPPTPICIPGRAAIRAALHPTADKALFFVARGDGTHQFSDTLEQHNQAVRQFQLKRSK